MTHRPLEGMRVLDLTRVASGPFTTMLMADMGAEVIKLERPGSGDEVRAMGRRLPGCDPRMSDYYVTLNRSKRSVAIDLSTPTGAEITRRLAACSDVFIENFRPGVADRLGVGFDAVRALRPHVVYTSISGFGSSGPWADRPANDVMMQSLSGLMGVTGEIGGAPVRLGSSISDFATGLFALSGTLAALVARDQFPEGQHVEVPMLDSSIAILPNFVPMANRGTRIERIGRRHPQIIGYASFECADGKYVTVGAFSEVFWRRLCPLLGHDEWLDDERFVDNNARVAHREILDGELDRVFRTRTSDEWLEALERADVPCAPVLEFHEAIATEQARHNDVVWKMRHGDEAVGVARNPIRSPQWSPYAPVPAPDVGAQTAEVLAEVLGLDDTEIDDLAAAGAIDLPKGD